MAESITGPNGRKIVLVTGAGRGIGRSSAVAFARAGYDVAGGDVVAAVSDILTSSRQPGPSSTRPACG